MPNSINNSSRYRSESSSGFTLIELLVTIVVLGIIVSIAAPNISTQLANQRVKSTTAILINALREAKAESVIRRKPVTVSYINDAESSNVSIQVPAQLSAAYLSPTLFPSAAVSRDWTSLFMSSAMAANDNSNSNGKETSEQRACRVCQQTHGKAAPQCTMCKPDGTDTDTDTDTGSGDLDSKLVSIAAYKYSAKTLIKSDSTQITFYPSRRIDKDAPFIYTICDGNNSVSPRQVTVNALGIISSKLGGTC
ncbi:Tfp pilus assembly protein FimT/FimU [Psychrobacter namhaensis]|uniref:Tfp pilus assembly protein FimT/FimU n=1 Tax=Psychrobacter namhaensis TaxID=292734 RepID=A0ABW8L8M2_9GAMM